jgi:glutathione S-transferase
MHYPWLKPLKDLGGAGINDLPRVIAWMDRIAERPAVVKGMAIPE